MFSGETTRSRSRPRRRISARVASIRAAYSSGAKVASGGAARNEGIGVVVSTGVDSSLGA